MAGPSQRSASREEVAREARRGDWQMHDWLMIVIYLRASAYAAASCIDCLSSCRLSLDRPVRCTAQPAVPSHGENGL